MMDNEQASRCNPRMMVYISREELREFLNGPCPTATGVSYGWEGEGVVHLRLHRARHAYGLTGPMLFCKAVPDEGDANLPPYVAVVSWDDGDAVAVLYGADAKPLDAEVHYVPARDQLYSRSKGILEVGVLASKRVCIIGLGSFGSLIAVELAKAGVGEFDLVDFDRVELHNLMRHTCGVHELGRLKTDAIADAVLAKNPYATVHRHVANVTEQLPLLDSLVADADLVVIATDNNASRFHINDALLRHNKVGIYGRAVTRAAGGDVFVQRPGGPCYQCLIGAGHMRGGEEVSSVESGRRSGVIAEYSDDPQAFVQVGLSSDIEPIINLMVKLSLVQLSHGTPSGIQCLETELVYDYYMWANRREGRHANWHALPGAGAMPTILRWYGAHIARDEGCVACQHTIDISGLDIDTGDMPIGDLSDLTLDHSDEPAP